MGKRRTDGPDGILLVDKPAGWTSHDAVARARRLLRQPRIGHAGTLDPFATGLLVLCLGQATRVVEYVMAHEKEYQGEIVLGAQTDTCDREGTVTSRGEVPPLDAGRLGSLARQFTGRIEQVPPAFSAVKVDGRRAYELARRGEAVDIAPRTVEVAALELAPVGPDRLRIAVRCGPGTYIRGLARDIGRALGCGGHLAELRRTRSGRFRVGDALTMEALERVAAANRVGEVLIPVDEGLLDRDVAILAGEGAAAFGHGSVHRAAAVARASEVARVYGTDGAFLGVGMVDFEGRIRPMKVFRA
jgi:tRNA pseudouridine55 synthase